MNDRRLIYWHLHECSFSGPFIKQAHYITSSSSRCLFTIYIRGLEISCGQTSSCLVSFVCLLLVAGKTKNLRKWRMTTRRCKKGSRSDWSSKSSRSGRITLLSSTIPSSPTPSSGLPLPSSGSPTARSLPGKTTPSRSWFSAPTPTRMSPITWW